jgi:hypothetical protein
MHNLLFDTEFLVLLQTLRYNTGSDSANRCSKQHFRTELATEPLSSISVIGAHNGKLSMGILESSKKLRTAALRIRERWPLYRTARLGSLSQGTQGAAGQPLLSLTLLSQDTNLAPDISQLTPSNANSFDAYPTLLQSYQSDPYNLWTDLAPQGRLLLHTGLVFQLR